MGFASPPPFAAGRPKELCVAGLLGADAAADFCPPRTRRVNSSAEYEYSGSGSYRRVSPISAIDPRTVSTSSLGISARKREGREARSCCSFPKMRR